MPTTKKRVYKARVGASIKSNVRGDLKKAEKEIMMDLNRGIAQVVKQTGIKARKVLVKALKKGTAKQVVLKRKTATKRKARK